VRDLTDALQAIALGALRSRGYGRVTVAETSVTEFGPLAERVKQFNTTFDRLWNDLRRLATNPNDVPERLAGTYFSVDLVAPGVFRQHGLPSLVPSLRVNDRTLEPIFWLTRPDSASGWSAAWGLPKPTDLAARAGSTYVFRWDGSIEALLPILERLEAQGIGERCDESFGECVICHPLHQEVSER